MTCLEKELSITEEGLYFTSLLQYLKQEYSYSNMAEQSNIITHYRQRKRYLHFYRGSYKGQKKKSPYNGVMNEKVVSKKLWQPYFTSVIAPFYLRSKEHKISFQNKNLR